MDSTRLQKLQRVTRITSALKAHAAKGRILLWSLVLYAPHATKRAVDITVSILLLFLLSPLFLLTALIIYLDDPGPVFYTQKRVGRHGRLFDFYKFRSMLVNADQMKEFLQQQNQSADGVIFKMTDDPRMTKSGKFIRKYSIDELPQLLNVFKGDMSLVGPRPALPKEVKQYSLEQRKRLDATPGITCIWQVSGRSNIPFTGQVRLDLEYIRTTNLMTDLTILLKTIPAVLTGKGAC